MAHRKTAIHQYLSDIGRRGGRNVSARKLAAVRANAAKARAAKASKHTHAGSGTYTTNGGIQAPATRRAARGANLPPTSTLNKQEQ